MHITTFAELRTALDYLPVAVRAASRNPQNTSLIVESIRAQRAVIEYSDTHLDEDDAAQVQATVGTIARFATINDGRDQYPEEYVATTSEAAKRRVLILTGAIDSYADMTEPEVSAHLANAIVSGHLDADGTAFMVRELRRRGIVHEDVFWWLVDRARFGDH